MQAEFHPRSLAPLRPHTHSFSELSEWSEGGEVMAREDAALDNDGPALLERVRRFLEEADSTQGFHLTIDADGAFAGIGQRAPAARRGGAVSAPPWPRSRPAPALPPPLRHSHRARAHLSPTSAAPQATRSSRASATSSRGHLAS